MVKVNPNLKPIHDMNSTPQSSAQLNSTMTRPGTTPTPTSWTRTFLRVDLQEGRRWPGAPTQTWNRENIWSPT